MIFALSLACDGYGQKLKQKNIEVYIKKPVTRDQGMKLLNFLVDSKFGATPGRKTLQLLKKEEVFQLRMVIKGKPEDLDPAALNSLKLIGGLVANQVLDGAELELHLCNNRLKTQKVLKIPKGLGDFGQKLMFGKGELFYKKGVEKEKAQQLGLALKQQRYFNAERTTSVQMSKDGPVYVLKFEVNRKLLESKPAVQAAFQTMGSQLRKAVLGNASVKLQLCTGGLADCFKSFEIQ